MANKGIPRSQSSQGVYEKATGAFLTAFDLENNGEDTEELTNVQDFELREHQVIPYQDPNSSPYHGGLTRQQLQERLLQAWKSKQDDIEKDKKLMLLSRNA